jgi:hypothetical protein
LSREFGREIANGMEARQIYRIGEYYASADETLAHNGLCAEPSCPQARGAASGRLRVS